MCGLLADVGLMAAPASGLAAITTVKGLVTYLRECLNDPDAAAPTVRVVKVRPFSLSGYAGDDNKVANTSLYSDPGCYEWLVSLCPPGKCELRVLRCIHHSVP